MRIVIDMQGAQTPSSRYRGVGRYTMGLAKAMSLNSREHEIVLALNGTFPDSVEAIRAEFEGILPQKNIMVWQQFYNSTSIDPHNAARSVAAQIIREEFLNNLNGEIVFSTNLQEGWLDSSCTSVKIISTNSLVCSTLHDIIPLIYPDKYLENSITKPWYEQKIDFIKKSDIVLTDSQSSKKEISKFVEIKEEKVYVIYPAVDHELFVPKNIGVTEAKQILDCVGISHPYVMYSGGGDSHKNLDTLYSAFSKLPKHILRSHQLVMVGGGLKEQANIQDGILEKLGISQNVIFTDYVADEMLVKLYSLCDLFIFPSIHEGFGIPPLEAMACGAPVIASNTASLPEVIGLQEALFDPFDVLDIQQHIERALTDYEFRETLKTHGIMHAKKFSWENSASALLDIFENILKNRKDDPKTVLKPDPIKNIISNISDTSSGILLEEADLVAISASIAETFSERSPQCRKLFLDVSSVIMHDHMTGIQRVVRAICNVLITTPQNIEVELVYTTPNDHEFYRANSLISKILGRRNNSSIDEWIEFCPGDNLLFLDLHPGVAITHMNKTKYLRNKGINVYYVVYDILPVQRPEGFVPELRNDFREWLMAVSNSNGAICISRAVADELHQWIKVNISHYLRPFKIGWFHLGADVENSVPTRGIPNDAIRVLHQMSTCPSFLMVGTLEPRKAHAQTLAAFDIMWNDGVQANLVIVGKQGWLMEEFAKKLRSHPEMGRRLYWLEGISDEYLEKVYESATCLIIASEGEGFGLPLIEAAQKKLPIISRDLTVFREVAGEHAYYFNGKEPSDISNALREWLVLFKEGKHPLSDNMRYLTWQQSVEQLLNVILRDDWYIDCRVSQT